MSTQAVARRYAKAFFELAREEGLVTQALGDLQKFADCYEASTELREIELNPSLHESDRRAIIEALGTQLKTSETATRLVAMLAERQRLTVLPDLVAMVEEMSDEHLEVLRATVRSARKLSQSYRTKLEKTLTESTGRKVLVTYEEDPELIAGVVTQIGDRVIDGSVRGRLRRLADDLRAP